MILECADPRTNLLVFMVHLLSTLVMNRAKKEADSSVYSQKLSGDQNKIKYALW